MGTRDSEITKLAKIDANVGDGNRPLRYCSVPCRLTGKRGVLLESALPLAEHFSRFAVMRGVGCHVVSIVANWIVLQTPALVVANFALFYTQVWSDVDRHFSATTSYDVFT